MPRSGSLTIAGHRVPTAAAVGVGLLLAVFLVLRARARGANVISAGTAGTSSTSTGAYDPNSQAIAQANDALSQLSNQLSSLQAQVASNPGAPPPCTCADGTAGCCGQDIAPGPAAGAVPPSPPALDPFSTGNPVHDLIFYAFKDFQGYTPDAGNAGIAWHLQNAGQYGLAQDLAGIAQGAQWNSGQGFTGDTAKLTEFVTAEYAQILGAHNVPMDQIAGHVQNIELHGVNADVQNFLQAAHAQGSTLR